MSDPGLWTVYGDWTYIVGFLSEGDSTLMLKSIVGWAAKFGDKIVLGLISEF